MRRNKIRRHNRVFRRRHVGRIIGKVCLWLLVIPAAIGGYFLAQYLFTRTPDREPDTPVSETAAPAQETAATTVEPEPEAPESSAALTSLRAIYLPAAALKDLSAWADTLSAAADAGYNAVLFDLKDADGALWYASETELAEQAQAVRADALTREELKGIIETLDGHSLLAVPRLYAFRDNTAPRYLETARVSLAGSPSSVWYDNDPSAGGRRWLNPYAADARGYITGLAAELRETGFSLIMLDGVQFPNQESRAYYGDAEQTALSRSEVLSLFAGEMTEAVGEGHWLLSTTALAAVGEKTTAYGGNPITYGAPAVSPWALPSQMGAALSLGNERVSAPAAHPYEALSLLFSQLQTRLQLMEPEERPAVVPWLQAEGYTAAQIAEETRAVTDCFGEEAPYILYRADGKYAF